MSDKQDVSEILRGEFSKSNDGINAYDLIMSSVAGLIGMMCLVPLFLLGTFSSVGTLQISAFEGLGNVAGFLLVSGDNSAIGGLVIFICGGIVTLPWMFLALSNFLPPENKVWAKGIVFSVIMWTGFAQAFYTGQTGIDLLAYILGGLVSHIVYGAVLGIIIQYMITTPKYRV